MPQKPSASASAPKTFELVSTSPLRESEVTHMSQYQHTLMHGFTEDFILNRLICHHLREIEKQKVNVSTEIEAMHLYGK